MLGSILVALITGGLSLVGVIMTNMSGNRQMENKLITAQAVTDNKIENLYKKMEDLTVEVRRNNDLANKVPILENELHSLKRENDDRGKDVEDIRRRIESVNAVVDNEFKNLKVEHEKNRKAIEDLRLSIENMKNGGK